MGHSNEYLVLTAGFHRCEYEPLCTAISIQDNYGCTCGAENGAIWLHLIILCLLLIRYSDLKSQKAILPVHQRSPYPPKDRS